MLIKITMQTYVNNANSIISCVNLSCDYLSISLSLKCLFHFLTLSLFISEQYHSYFYLLMYIIISYVNYNKNEINVDVNNKNVVFDAKESHFVIGLCKSVNFNVNFIISKSLILLCLWFELFPNFSLYSLLLEC
jgi:hypothetical protein